MEEGLVSFKVLHRSAYFLPSFALYGVSSEGRVVAKSILLFTTSSSFFFFTIELFIFDRISFGKIFMSFVLNKFVQDKKKKEIVWKSFFLVISIIILNLLRIHKKSYVCIIFLKKEKKSNSFP